MQQIFALRGWRAFHGDSADARQFSDFDAEANADELVSVVDFRFGVDLGLKISIPVKEIGQRLFRTRKTREIVWIFVVEIHYLKQARVVKLFAVPGKSTTPR